MEKNKKFKHRPKFKKPQDNYVPKGDPKALSTPIEQLGLSDATYNALSAGKIATAYDLANKKWSEMYRIQNIGKKNCIEISKKLATLGLTFREEEVAEDKVNTNVERIDTQKSNQNNDINKNAKQNLTNKNRNSSLNNSKFVEQNANKVQENPNQNNNNRNRNRNEQSGNERRNNQKRTGSLPTIVDDKQTNDSLEQKSNKKQNNKVLNNYNKGLNDSLTRQYAGLSINEIIVGKRQRPMPQKVEKDRLTPDSIIKFCRNGKWGYKDWKGNVIIQPVYEEACNFSGGLACVEKQQKMGFIDKNNNLVIDYKFDSATSFNDGLASVTIGDKSGYINTAGEVVIDLIYDKATPFYDGKAVVKAKDRWGVIDKEGKVFWR